MTLCPIAIAASCKKCPAFSVCPLKTVIGDYIKPEKNRNQATGGHREEITDCDLTRASDLHCFAASLVGPCRVLVEYESRTITYKAYD